MPKSALPPNLQDRRHEDLPWPFSLIPRAWTAFKWGVPILQRGNLSAADFVWGKAFAGSKARAPQDKLWGPRPITSRGTWQLSKFFDGPFFAWYFAFTTTGGTHFRIGARWDDVDGYVEFPTLAIKRNI